MSWLSRLFILPKSLNSGGDYVRKYAPQIREALRGALVAKAQELHGSLNADDISDYVLNAVKLPTWGRIMLQMLLYGVVERAIDGINDLTSVQQVDAIVDAIMAKIEALK